MATGASLRFVFANILIFTSSLAQDSLGLQVFDDKKNIQESEFIDLENLFSCQESLSLARRHERFLAAIEKLEPYFKSFELKAAQRFRDELLAAAMVGDINQITFVGQAIIDLYFKKKRLELALLVLIDRVRADFLLNRILERINHFYRCFSEQVVYALKEREAEIENEKVDGVGRLVLTGAQAAGTAINPGLGLAFMVQKYGWNFFKKGNKANQERLKDIKKNFDTRSAEFKNEFSGPILFEERELRAFKFLKEPEFADGSRIESLDKC